MRCDVIAEGVVAAAKEVSLRCRWWFALKAPTSKRAKKILATVGLAIIVRR